ncbi:protein phosphatase CheZ [Marinobacterium nitratireducens]|uniref:Protein phosphatase CheZ n=1 Tax=Marinobacterium nitratireducens TaxID=518897 RepID=A0A917ZJY9_9GAMM|nr:protein phosphatase CheZ [Marinobacterium nitratireducens]GGO85034.1 protein phosphatase CheZ [Marinobacterium nitratireducens]
MSGAKITSTTDSLEALLQGKAQELVAVLERGDLPDAMSLISELQAARHDAFYREVGRLTRGLHEAIKSFSSEIGVPEAQRGQLSAMTDASERLDYVIQLTERAAHDTLDRVDRTLALVDRFAGRQDLPEDTTPQLEQMRGELTEILVGQGFQDITGQLIRRVMQLLTQVESQLVDLMEMAAKVDRLNNVRVEEPRSVAAPADPARAEGPQVRPADGAAVARNQDDVDDLLSSLGF